MLEGDHVNTVSPLQGVADGEQRLGSQNGAAGVAITVVSGVAMATLAARQGRGGDLRAKLLALHGLALPDAGRSAGAGRMRALWIGPEQYILLLADADAQNMAGLVRELAGLAAVTDQSDARAVIEVSGPYAREALAKGVMIDLDPRVFVPGATAITLVAHLTVQITLLDEAPVFEFLVPRSTSRDFWHWLTSSAAEFGATVDEKTV